jgi:uncharacterized protein
MKFNINEIPANGLELTERANASDWDIETSGIKFEAPLDISARVIKEGDEVYVTVTVSGNIIQECSRCLNKFTVPLSGRYEFVYSAREKNVVDLTEDIRQEIMLNYPLKPLCKSDCKGLCPVCGKNLNEGECGCDRNLKNWDKK